MATQAQATAEMDEWLATAVGRSMPNQYGNQCTALVQSYVETLFQRPFAETLRYGNAIDHIDLANREYFDVIWNDPSKPDLLPRRGDIAVYKGAAPLWDGRYYGHTGVVDSFTRATQTLIQQDGVAPPTRVFPDGYSYSVKPAHRDTFAYVGDVRVGDVRGWLRPKASKVVNTGADLRGYGAGAPKVAVQSSGGASPAWYPGAIRDEQAHGVKLDKTLPRRATWHITSDVDPGKQQPPAEAVWAYLKRMKYCPHILWDPVTGKVWQAYPASVGGRALAAWNEDGAVHLQVEVLFSQGAIRDGKRYDKLADTPLKGLPELLEWIDGHGIPRTWPMGEPPPLHSASRRDVATWNSRAGHYGHCHVPDNNHTDPGVFPDITKLLPTAGKDGPLMVTVEDERKIEAIVLRCIQRELTYERKKLGGAKGKVSLQDQIMWAARDQQVLLERLDKVLAVTDKVHSGVKALAKAVHPSRLALLPWTYRNAKVNGTMDAYGVLSELSRQVRDLYGALGLAGSAQTTGSTALTQDTTED